MGQFVWSPREMEKRDRKTGEEIKERKRKERGTGMKVKKQKKQKHSPSTLTCYKDSRSCLTVNQYQLDAPVTSDIRHLRITRPPLYFTEIPVFDVNSVDPDQMPHSAASDLGLQCLPMSLL